MKEEIFSKPVPRTKLHALIILSRVASFVFHPLFMTSVAVFVIYKFLPQDLSDKSLQSFKKWFGEILLFTILLPFVAIFLFRISGVISNARMHQPRDRILPLLATMVFYLAAYILFCFSDNAHGLICSLLLGSSSAIIIIFIINFFYKVSVHTSAAAILISISMILLITKQISVALFLVMWLVAITVGIVRWLLGAHTVGQILLGYALGIVTQLSAYFIFFT